MRSRKKSDSGNALDRRDGRHYVRDADPKGLFGLGDSDVAGAIADAETQMDLLRDTVGDLPAEASSVGQLRSADRGPRAAGVDRPLQGDRFGGEVAVLALPGQQQPTGMLDVGLRGIQLGDRPRRVRYDAGLECVTRSGWPL